MLWPVNKKPKPSFFSVIVYLRLYLLPKPVVLRFKPGTQGLLFFVKHFHDFVLKLRRFFIGPLFRFGIARAGLVVVFPQLPTKVVLPLCVCSNMPVPIALSGNDRTVTHPVDIIIHLLVALLQLPK
jgi:hypothetical protein